MARTSASTPSPNEAPSAGEDRPVLELDGVSKIYQVSQGFFGGPLSDIRAVDDVRLTLRDGEILGLVGESGCGKSTLARLALALELPSKGRVLFRGRDLASLDRAGLQGFRRSAQMVFQDPFSSLNPKKTVFQILSEPLRIHRLCPKNELRDRLTAHLADVGLDPKTLDRYPHEFSGGQRQRIGVARALATQPRLIVADEPTSALDVSIQAQIINLLLDLQERYRLSYLFISHDLPIVRFVSHRIAVMYRGRLVELMPRSAFEGTAAQGPHHPYTAYLLGSVPVPDPEKSMFGAKAAEEKRVEGEKAGACVFSDRCPLSAPRCLSERPAWKKVGPGHYLACHELDS